MSTSAHDFPCALVYVEDFFKETMVDSFQCSFVQDRSAVPVVPNSILVRRNCHQFYGVGFSEL